jgi:hypothetical protein
MKIRNLLLLFLVLFIISSCSDNDDDINKTLVHVNVKMPEGIQDKNARIVEASFHLENVNTGEKQLKDVDYFPVSYFDIEDGLYNINVSAIVEYDSKNKEGDVVTTNRVDVRALKENVEVVGGNFDLPLTFFLYNPSSTFVISEIFFAGTKTPEGKGYRYDKFFEIYNNSDKILYADGLCIGESALNSTVNYDKLTPESVKTTKTVLHAIYRISGTGKQYPIQPGKTIVLADIAKDHTVDNVNGIDLSEADFEWYDNDKRDVDVPEVVNLEKVVSYSPTIWSPLR